jgi:hypothetical protein
MKGLGLYILAILLRVPLFFMGFIVGIIRSFHPHRFKTGLKKVDQKFEVLAKSIDKYGNVVCAELFNWTLITAQASVSFGRIEQTISAVLGHNEAAGTLTKTGKALVYVLDFFDPGHTQRAAKEDTYKN